MTDEVEMNNSSQILRTERLLAIVVVTGLAVTDIAWSALLLTGILDAYLSGCCPAPLPLSLWGVSFCTLSLAWLLSYRIRIEQDDSGVCPMDIMHTVDGDPIRKKAALWALGAAGGTLAFMLSAGASTTATLAVTGACGILFYICATLDWRNATYITLASIPLLILGSILVAPTVALLPVIGVVGVTSLFAWAWIRRDAHDEVEALQSLFVGRIERIKMRLRFQRAALRFSGIEPPRAPAHHPPPSRASISGLIPRRLLLAVLLSLAAGLLFTTLLSQVRSGGTATLSQLMDIDLTALGISDTDEDTSTGFTAWLGLSGDGTDWLLGILWGLSAGMWMYLAWESRLVSSSSFRRLRETVAEFLKLRDLYGDRQILLGNAAPRARARVRPASGAWAGRPHAQDNAFDPQVKSRHQPQHTASAGPFSASAEEHRRSRPAPPPPPPPPPRTAAEQDHLRILGVSSGASQATVRKAYLRLAKKYHPDKVGAIGEEIMKQINAAYATATDNGGDARKSADPATGR